VITLFKVEFFNQRLPKHCPPGFTAAFSLVSVDYVEAEDVNAVLSTLTTALRANVGTDVEVDPYENILRVTHHTMKIDRATLEDREVCYTSLYKVSRL
jgi:hypothetical protein